MGGWVPYGITYRDEKDKRRAENICTFKKDGIKSEEGEEEGALGHWGGRPTTFCLTAITARADIAVITRLTKVFPHRRCTSIRPSVRPSLIAVFDKSLTHFGKLF